MKNYYIKSDMHLSESSLYQFWLDIMSDQTRTCSDKHRFWLENVRCLTIISSTANKDISTTLKILSKIHCIEGATVDVVSV